jgi:predicted glycogen debranching enzyme
MTSPRIEPGRGELDTFEGAASREWLVTNGLGGFASGTVAGACTRRYHGLLVAALKPPVERVVLVAKLDAHARYDGATFALGSNEYADGTIDPRGFEHLASFALDGLTPVWRWTLGDALLEQRITMVHGENTTVVSFELVRASSRLTLALRPLCTYRDYHGHARGGWTLGVTPLAGGCELRAFEGAAPYRIVADKGLFDVRPEWHWSFRHRAETARGLDDREDLFVPGEFAVELAPGDTVTLTLSAAAPTESASTVAPFERERRRQQKLLEAAPAGAPDWIRQLSLAADQFIVRRANAGHTVIAGYPWFSDWGRDTMIALPGLALATGRYDVAASVLRTFARAVSEGMLPNRFPDVGEQPEYNTVDATLWYFHALDQYVAASGDRKLVAELYPTLIEIVQAHLRGTRYRIHVDSDGLLYAGEPGVQLTWMDAKVGDWVVTPRIGKPVEINALWYRALVVMQSFAALADDALAERRFAALAGNVLRAFRRRYWLADRGWLADVIDGPDGAADPTLRPNQVFAVSIDPELLDRAQARAVVDVCARRLWTPLGLRSLAPNEPGYVARYGGGPRERDGAYHQGTVWSWLLGPFALAHWHVYRDAAAARQWLDGIAAHLRTGCIGQVSEIFDGDPPHRAEGCFAQAWSVAEVLRAWVEIGAAAAEQGPGASLRAPERRSAATTGK